MESSTRGEGAAWSMKNTAVGTLTLHPPEVAQLLDGERSGAVLGDGQVDQSDHDLPGRHRLDTRVGGDDLFGDGRRRGHARAGPAQAAAAPELGRGRSSPSRAM